MDYVPPNRDDPRLAPFAARGLGPPACELMRASAVTFVVGRDLKFVAVIPDKRPVSIRTQIRIAALLLLEATASVVFPTDVKRLSRLTTSDAEFTTVCDVDQVDGGREWHKLILWAPPDIDAEADERAFPGTFEVCHVVPKGHSWSEFLKHMRTRGG